MHSRPHTRRYFSLLAGLLLAACSSGSVRLPRWDLDGKHIFYVEDRYTFWPNMEGPDAFRFQLFLSYARLTRALPDRSSAERVFTGRLHYDSFWQSPNGRHILYLEGRGPFRLTVRELASGDELRTLRLDTLELRHPGWRPDSEAFYYTDDDGDIQVVPIDDFWPTERLVVGPAQPRAWSPDGRHLFYTSGPAEYIETNRLMVLDTKTRETREVLAPANGKIEHVAVAPDGQRVAFAVSLRLGERRDNSLSIQVAAVDGSSPEEIWHGPARYVSHIGWTAQPGELLLDFQPRGYDHVLACLGPERVLREVTQGPRGFTWSYHLGTRQLMHPDRTTQDFVTRRWTGCDAAHPEVDLREYRQS